MRKTVVLLGLFLAAPIIGGAQGLQTSGETVYKLHCASCHDGTAPLTPSRDAMKEMGPEHIDNTLNSLIMRRQGAVLTRDERRAVADFLSGRPAGSFKAPLEVIPKNAYCSTDVKSARDALAGSAWNGWGLDSRNTRFQSAAGAGLSPADVPRLKLKWAFGFPGVSVSGSQVTVVGERAFVGTRNGVLYAIDTRTGCIVWAFEADAGVRSTPVVVLRDGAATLYFGDAHAQAYAVDAATGEVRWKTKVESHADAMITAGVAYANGRIIVPVASLEEASAVTADYECCTFRGSVVALDVISGAQVWKTYVIPETPEPTSTSSRGTQLLGPSGAAVWSTPAIDVTRDRLFITTGNSYSQPTARTSDAIMALSLSTGRILWIHQATSGDTFNRSCRGGAKPGQSNCPEKAGPDLDFGASPVIVTLSDGRTVVVAGQKSGEMHALNPDTGEPLWRTRVSVGGPLGGIEWGFATDGAIAYLSLSEIFTKSPEGPGGLVAIDLANGQQRWSAPPPSSTCAKRRGCNTAQPAAVSAIPGVVFSGSLDGHLRAYDSATGKVVWDVDTATDYTTVNGVPAKGGSLNGPGATVAGGTLFVSSGYSSLGFMPGNVLLAFSVDGR